MDPSLKALKGCALPNQSCKMTQRETEGGSDSHTGEPGRASGGWWLRKVQVEAAARHRALSPLRPDDGGGEEAGGGGGPFRMTKSVQCPMPIGRGQRHWSGMSYKYMDRKASKRTGWSLALRKIKSCTGKKK